MTTVMEGRPMETAAKDRSSMAMRHPMEAMAERMAGMPVPEETVPMAPRVTPLLMDPFAVVSANVVPGHEFGPVSRPTRMAVARRMYRPVLSQKSAVAPVRLRRGAQRDGGERDAEGRSRPAYGPASNDRFGHRSSP